ncbi:MAG: acyl-CoA thioesterase [Planctomycetaceae bacterium]|nr:acyl-CoA thioesterase [Planctomycetaceae bacterium]
MNDLTGKYPVVLTQDVIWRDLDAFEHVNNAVYFRYFEDARIAYFERTGILAYKQETNRGPILASTKCDFRAPLTYPDRIHIATTVEGLQGKRFMMKYLVFSERVGGLAAEGEGLIVYYDYAAGRSCEVPESIVLAINEIEATVGQGH